MSSLAQRLLGALLAVLLFGLSLLPGPGAFFVCLPLFFISFIAFGFPQAGRSLLLVYAVGLAVGKLALDHYPLSWIFPEILALAALVCVASFIQAQHAKEKERLLSQFEARKKEYESLRGVSDNLKRENTQIEKRLRQIEHLYDVIKEAASTLNVQEMIELTKDFTERMFDLPHFVVAVLSNDSRKFETRIASGCDDSLLKSLEIELESDELASLLSREKKPVWVPSVGSDDRFSKLRGLAIQSFIFLPFLVQERVIGFLCSYSSQEHFIDQEKFSHFQVFCNQISIGLQKSLLYERVQKLSITDGLTKLFSHRHFKQRLEEELILANRYSSPLSLLMLDIDHFKHYNDNYGHVAGDHVLMEVARILKVQSEMTHIAARYGGEEMVLIAPETTKERAMELSENIRKAVENYGFVVGKETTKVTVSIGVATYPQDAQASLDLIGKADEALYEAKARGRNRIVAYPFEPLSEKRS